MFLHQRNKLGTIRNNIKTVKPTILREISDVLKSSPIATMDVNSFYLTLKTKLQKLLPRRNESFQAGKRIVLSAINLRKRTRFMIFDRIP
jgi:hypothetical protein